jgi:histidinol-phosphate aminotransferase
VNYVRQAIAGMAGYTPGEQPQGGEFIKLNTNENPYPVSDAVKDAITAELDKLQLYSDPVSRELCQEAALLYGLETDQVIAGNGSDDILNILIRAAAGEGETVASFTPSYTLYRTLAEIQGAQFKTFEFTEDYQVPADLDLTGVRILFLPNPNSPSGTLVDHDTFRRLCRDCPGLVVADEAYADFAGENTLPLLLECENLVITRTFSKSYSLAGLRIGLGMASAAIIAELMKVKDSYNLDRIAQAAGAAALRDQASLREHTERIIVTRTRLTRELEALGCSVYPAHGNFVLARFPQKPAREIQEALTARRILVRYFDAPRLDDCLRISIGTEEETDALLAALTHILQ